MCLYSKYEAIAQEKYARLLRFLQAANNPCKSIISCFYTLVFVLFSFISSLYAKLSEPAAHIYSSVTDMRVVSISFTSARKWISIYPKTELNYFFKMIHCCSTVFNSRLCLCEGPLWPALTARNRATPLILSSASHCQSRYLIHGKVTLYLVYE